MSLTEGGLTFRTAGGGDKNSKNQVGLEKFITRGGFSLCRECQHPIITNLMMDVYPTVFLGVLIKTGHVTNIITDWTEFKLEQPHKYNLSTLSFTKYKNAFTWKVLVVISQIGNGIKYTGSMCDCNIIEKSDLIN